MPSELAPSTADPYVPPGRPVPRFVATLVVLTVVLVVLAFVGPLRADVDASISEWTVEDGRADARITVTNRGRFAVEVTGVDGDGLASSSPIDPVRLEPGETTVVATTLEPDCASFFGGFGPPLEVESEVVFGLHRSTRSGAGLDMMADSVCNP